MTNPIKMMLGTALVASALTFPSAAQVTPQTFAKTNVDQTALSTGYRTSKVVGSPVVNKAGETIGTIDDLIVTPNDKVPFAILSVGGFLGMATKYVVVPYSDFVIRDKKMTLPEATKDTLKALPEFEYSK